MKHFTFTSRRMLAELLQSKESYRQIAKILQKSISSISDEIRRNSEHGAYDSYRAHEISRVRALERRKRTKLEISEGLKQYVISKLKEDWSPEQIDEQLRNEANGKTVISHETIYQFIYSDEGKSLRLWTYLRHKKKPERKHWGTRKRRTIIPSRVSIHKRPAHVNNREAFGHWEADLMIFSHTKSVLAVFVERKTRKTVAVVNENKTASEMEMALHELLSTAGQTNVHSITFDNGTENICHQKIREDYSESFTTFFCDPYCSWQKGSVENMNKLFRQYFPRDILPKNLNQDAVDTAVKKLNSRPRKCIGYKTPSDMFTTCSV